mmetsp:Transcript_126104/g.368518  ORF Transcript_126104/g.368518 Transcript_126104/m.368518 type:complete len:205 (+) Transcript_126104:902-1516(+)
MLASSPTARQAPARRTRCSETWRSRAGQGSRSGSCRAWRTSCGSGRGQSQPPPSRSASWRSTTRRCTTSSLSAASAPSLEVLPRTLQEGGAILLGWKSRSLHGSWRAPPRGAPARRCSTRSPAAATPWRPCTSPGAPRPRGRRASTSWTWRAASGRAPTRCRRSSCGRGSTSTRASPPWRASWARSRAAGGSTCPAATPCSRGC